MLHLYAYTECSRRPPVFEDDTVRIMVGIRRQRGYMHNKCSIITIQLEFNIWFEFRQHDFVPVRKIITVWVSHFRANGFCTEKRKSSGRFRTLKTWKNSALKYAAGLELSDRRVRRILHRDFHMHPYKIMVIHEFSERDFETLRAVCEYIFQNTPAGCAFISATFSGFITGVSTKSEPNATC